MVIRFLRHDVSHCITATSCDKMSYWGIQHYIHTEAPVANPFFVRDDQKVPGKVLYSLYYLTLCGTRPHRWRRETWWWNEHEGEVITAKRQASKAWKTGKGTRASYHADKRIARRAVHHARQEADKEVYKNIDSKSPEVYRLANQFRRENADDVGDKPVKNDAGKMSMSEDSKRKAWLEHYQRLLNAEFDWDRITCLMNHQWKDRQSQSPLIWLRRLFLR